jgi:hypothetical protein
MATIGGYNARNFFGGANLYPHYQVSALSANARHRLPAVGDNPQPINYGYPRADKGAVSRGVLGGDTRWNEGFNTGDPHWNEVVCLLALDGSDTSTTIVDAAPSGSIDWSVRGNAQLDTADKKFGTASLLLDGTGDAIDDQGSPTDRDEFAFGTGDFTIEMFIKHNYDGGTQILFDGRTSLSQPRPTIYIVSAGDLRYYVNGSARITSGGGTISDGTSWHHIAVARSGTSTRLFVDGTQVGSTWTDTVNYEPCRCSIGLPGDGLGSTSLYFDGWVDAVRVTKGTARYTGTFTPPAAFYPTGAGAATAVTQVSNQVTPEVNNFQLGDRGDRDSNRTLRDGHFSGYTWFERVHILPQSLDLGNVVSELVNDVELFNAYRTDVRTLSSITNNAGDGITLDAPATPATLSPMTSVIIGVTVSPIGPPTIDGDLVFAFDVRSITLPLTGTRVVLFPYPPQNAVQEELEWRTAINTAADRSENRIALRNWPRKSLRYDILLGNLVNQQLNTIFLHDWVGRVFGVPLWWDRRLLTSSPTAGVDTQVFVQATDYADFRDGGLCALVHFNEDGTIVAEALELQGIDSPLTSLTFTTPVQNSYTAGVDIAVPVVPCVMSLPLQQRSTRGTSSDLYNARFRALENIDSVTPQIPASYETIVDQAGLTIPVLNDDDFMDDVLAQEFRTSVRITDFDLGIFFQNTQARKPVRSQPKLWVAQSAQRLWELRELLAHLRGSQRSFLLPTYRKDLTLALPTTADSPTLDVESVGLVGYHRAEEPWNYVEVVMKDAWMFASPTGGSPNKQKRTIHRITGIVQQTDTIERVSITPNTQNYAFDANDVERISLVTQSRIDDDRAVITHNWSDELGQAVDAEVRVNTVGSY